MDKITPQSFKPINPELSFIFDLFNSNLTLKPQFKSSLDFLPFDIEKSPKNSLKRPNIHTKSKPIAPDYY